MHTVRCMHRERVEADCVGGSSTNDLAEPMDDELCAALYGMLRCSRKRQSKKRFYCLRNEYIILIEVHPMQLSLNSLRMRDSMVVDQSNRNCA